MNNGCDFPKQAWRRLWLFQVKDETKTYGEKANRSVHSLVVTKNLEMRTGWEVQQQRQKR